MDTNSFETTIEYPLIKAKTLDIKHPACIHETNEEQDACNNCHPDCLNPEASCGCGF